MASMFCCSPLNTAVRVSVLAFVISTAFLSSFVDTSERPVSPEEKKWKKQDAFALSERVRLRYSIDSNSSGVPNKDVYKNNAETVNSCS